MSNRFHSKYHKHNHHTRPTNPEGMYPDSGYDPIASPESPFQGDFHLSGNFIALSAVVAKEISSSIGSVEDLFVGNLIVSKDQTVLDTFVTCYSSTEIINAGLTPAFRVTQTGDASIAEFSNDISKRIVFDYEGQVGLGTSTPTSLLHLVKADHQYPTEIFVESGYTNSNLRLKSPQSSEITFEKPYATFAKIVGSPSLSSLSFNTNGLTQMTLTSSGNLHLGVNPMLIDGGPTSKYLTIQSQQGPARLYVISSQGPSVSIRGGSQPNLGFSSSLDPNVFAPYWQLIQNNLEQIQGYPQNSFTIRHVASLNTPSTVAMTTFLSSGEVGIGTTSPRAGYKLDVEGTAFISGVLTLGRKSTIQDGGQVTFNRSVDNAPAWSIDTFGTAYTPRLRFFTPYDNSEKATILANGNVGIGIADPLSPLHVAGVTTTTILSSTELYVNNPTGDARVEVGSGTGNAYVDLKSPESDDYDLRLFTNGTQASINSSGTLFINESTAQNVNLVIGGGNVGVNTNNPNKTLTVNGQISSTGELFISSSNSNQINLVNQTYGTIFRNDNTDFWIIPTASGDPTGSYDNVLRPLSIKFATGRVSIGNGLSVTGTATLNTGLTAVGNTLLSGTTDNFGNVTIHGNLSSTGLQTFANTIFNTTAALSVIHVGTGPALYVTSNSSDAIASFVDTDQGIELLHIGGTNVGVKTINPGKDFTVKGEISASGTIWNTDGNSNNWNSVYSSVAPTSASWNSVYSNVNATSALVATIVRSDNKYLPLSGGAINGNLTIFGDLTSTGTQTFANTVFTNTSSISVVHTGNGPAFYVGSNSSGDIASFYDIDQQVEVLHIGGANSIYPNVGIKVSNPGKDLTVKGEISASSTIWDQKGNSNNWNSVYSSVVGTSASWDSVYSNVRSNSATYSTIARSDSKFVPLTGATIGGSLTITGNLSSNGFQSFANTSFSTSIPLSVLHSGSGPALYVSSNSSNPIASFYDADQSVEVLHVGGIDGNATNVGIKTSTPGKDLTVKGEISASSTIWDATGNSVLWNTVYSLVKQLSSTWSGNGQLITNTATVSVSPTFVLSQYITDIEILPISAAVDITGFTNGVKGTTYTLTNKTFAPITIYSSPSVIIRRGNGWRSNTASMSGSYLILPLSGSCSVRADQGFVSVW